MLPIGSLKNAPGASGARFVTQNEPAFGSASGGRAPPDASRSTAVIDGTKTNPASTASFTPNDIVAFMESEQLPTESFPHAVQALQPRIDAARLSRSRNESTTDVHGYRPKNPCASVFIRG